MTEPQATTTEAPAPAAVPELLPPEPTTKELMALSPEDRLAIERRDAGSYVFDPGAFALVQKVAASLAGSSLLPKHLCEDKGGKRLPDRAILANCMFLVADAMRWRMSPHALMPECYPRPGGGGLSYQGKVIAGILNKFLGIRLNYRYSGTGGERTCIAFATLPDETDERAATVVFKDAVTHESKEKGGGVKPAWSRDPDQKLSYNAAIKWGRLHAPELVTGVITADEADEMAEERRALLPTTPTPGAQPQSLVDFAAGKLDPQKTPQEATGRNGGVAEPAPPPAATAAPGAPASPTETTPEAPVKARINSIPASRKAIAELEKLGTDAKLSAGELNEMAREVCEGRSLAQLLESDVLKLMEQLIQVAKDRGRGA